MHKYLILNMLEENMNQVEIEVECIICIADIHILDRVDFFYNFIKQNFVMGIQVPIKIRKWIPAFARMTENRYIFIDNLWNKIKI